MGRHTMHTDKYKGKYRIASARLATWDYGRNAAYFITICTHQRMHVFGTVVDCVFRPAIAEFGIDLAGVQNQRHQNTHANTRLHLRGRNAIMTTLCAVRLNANASANILSKTPEMGRRYILYVGML